jgi:hypothetical protein
MRKNNYKPRRTNHRNMTGSNASGNGNDNEEDGENEDPNNREKTDPS